MRRVIVCLDDYEQGLAVRRAALEIQGFKVVTTSDVRVGIAMCMSNSVGLLIVDYAMPDMSGVEVAAHVRRARPTLPILMLSGHVFDGPVPHVDCFVSKGAPVEEVLDQVRKLLKIQG